LARRQCFFFGLAGGGDVALGELDLSQTVQSTYDTRGKPLSPWIASAFSNLLSAPKRSPLASSTVETLELRSLASYVADLRKSIERLMIAVLWCIQSAKEISILTDRHLLDSLSGSRQVQRSARGKDSPINLCMVFQHSCISEGGERVFSSLVPKRGKAFWMNDHIGHTSAIPPAINVRR
jgi:hypothetical protein